MHENLDMGSNIFYAAKEVNCTNIYTLGSVCSYPMHCPIPFKEDDLWNGYPEKSNAPYGTAKRVLLMLSQTYREQYGFTGAHLIPVNLYGPHDHTDPTNSHVVPALIRKFETARIKNLLEVKCWGSGTATRELLYAADAADVILQTVISSFDSPFPINLGTGKDISIYDLSYLIAKLTGYEGSIVFTGEVSDGQPKRRLDVSRAKQLLNWESTTSLETGLTQTINWFRKTQDI